MEDAECMRDISFMAESGSRPPLRNREPSALSGDSSAEPTDGRRPKLDFMALDRLPPIRLGKTEKTFVDAYLRSMDPIFAALSAGCKGNPATAGGEHKLLSFSHDMLNRPAIIARIGRIGGNAAALMRRESSQAAMTLIEMARDPSIPPQVRLAANKEILGMSGFSATQKVEFSGSLDLVLDHDAIIDKLIQAGGTVEGDYSSHREDDDIEGSDDSEGS